MFSTLCLNVVNAISCAIAEFKEGLVFGGFGWFSLKKKKPTLKKTQQQRDKERPETTTKNSCYDVATQ